MPSKPRLVDLRGGRKIPPPSSGDIRPREPRRSTLKERKRRTRAVITAAVCVCTLLTTYAVHAASYLPRFTYQHVSVSGAHLVAPTQIEAFVEDKLGESSRGFISGRNIFVFKYSTLPNVIVANFPAVRSASVSRDTSMGNGLIVTLQERTPYAEWCEESIGANCYLLDDQGVVFAPASGVATSSLPSQYIFSGILSTTTLSVSTPPYGEIFAGTHFSGISDLLKRLHSAGVTPLGAELQDDTDFFIPLAEGFYLKASYGEDPDTLAKNLTLILNADALKGKTPQLEYIDLRFGNRVYYKFKGQPQSQ